MLRQCPAAVRSSVEPEAAPVVESEPPAADAEAPASDDTTAAN